jgi:hypothetical protein
LNWLENKLKWIKFSCYYDGTGYVCSCLAPFTGKRCETNMNGISKSERNVLLNCLFL